jgi:hypothetical protein
VRFFPETDAITVPSKVPRSDEQATSENRKKKMVIMERWFKFNTFIRPHFLIKYRK